MYISAAPDDRLHGHRLPKAAAVVEVLEDAARVAGGARLLGDHPKVVLRAQAVRQSCLTERSSSAQHCAGGGCMPAAGRVLRSSVMRTLGRTPEMPLQMFSMSGTEAGTAAA